MFDYLRVDLGRKRNHYFLKDTFFEKFVMTSLQLGTLAVIVYRLGNWAGRNRNRLLRLGGSVIYYLFRFSVGTAAQIYINPGLTIGKGLIIHNFSGVVIDAETAGENLTVNQGVTIGPGWRGNGRPIIGNNIFIGSGAKVLGPIRIGDNVVVAANALVIDDVPDNCTVVGVPARVISRQATSNYLQLGAVSADTGATGIGKQA
jgi:serine O-acetyltransferase